MYLRIMDTYTILLNYQYFKIFRYLSCTHFVLKLHIKMPQPIIFKGFVALFCLLKLNMSIDIVLYKWHKIKVFYIVFSYILNFISAYLIFCKHIASTDTKLYYAGCLLTNGRMPNTLKYFK